MKDSEIIPEKLEQALPVQLLELIWANPVAARQYLEQVTREYPVPQSEELPDITGAATTLREVLETAGLWLRGGGEWRYTESGGWLPSGGDTNAAQRLSGLHKTLRQHLARHCGVGWNGGAPEDRQPVVFLRRSLAFTRAWLQRAAWRQDRGISPGHLERLASETVRRVGNHQKWRIHKSATSKYSERVRALVVTLPEESPEVEPCFL